MRLIMMMGLLMASGASPQSAENMALSTPVEKTTASASDTKIIPIYMSADRALVMLRIADGHPVPVVFDTGTNGNLLDKKMADGLGLPNIGPSRAIDGSTGKPVPGYDSFIKDARLGGVAIADDRATVLPYDLTDEIGIFGPNSFPDRLVEMDGPGSQLIIRAKTPANIPKGEALPYKDSSGSPLPFAVVIIDNLAITATLDSGNNVALRLPMGYKDKLDLQAPPVPAGIAVSAAGSQPTFKARLKGSLQIGSFTFDQPEVQFMEGGHPNVGLPILRKLSIIYDHSGSRSWILPPKS
ncbi:retropepsin-like aspartic protease [Parasphingorhabdus cellanae]|uniref:Retropepsin-like domain-containing protein n=1 Tax=Parasphingorhabdus cellanae TaxID=2806553 RepID=A0ABX7T5X1_9SPHN|nr:retropepsin-like aspartic protease [Parasphingorhabdus cellanae]QTD56978.1 retropepsin-like domain-containing protein [Parasphingorhabdus cellanae]